MSFSQMAARLFAVDPFMLTTTPIHSIADPWLGVGTQLYSLPHGILRVLLVALPTYCASMYCVPAFAAALAESQGESLLSHLSCVSNLYLNISTFMAAIRATERRSVPSELDGYSQYRTKFIFTRKQGTRMMKRFRRYALERDRDSVGRTRGEWMKFLQGRNTVVIDDVDSELTSRTSKSDNMTVRAGHAQAIRSGPVAAQSVPLDRQEPVANHQGERFFLYAEVESRRNADMNMNEMMNRLRTGAQADRQQDGPVDVPQRDLLTGQGLLLPNLESTFREPSPARPTDAERAASEQAERSQRRLLMNEDFPPIAAMDDNGTGLLNLVLSLTGPYHDFMHR